MTGPLTCLKGDCFVPRNDARRAYNDAFLKYLTYQAW